MSLGNVLSLISNLAGGGGSTAVKPRPELKREPKRQATQFSQPVHRAGLLVTAELDLAIARCRARVQRIAALCRRRNVRFRDIEFDLEGDRERCLHGLATPPEDRFDPADVLRVHQIFDDPVYFVNGPESGDVIQGALGDCYFLSALANVSCVPGLVSKCCVEQDEKVGVYGFIFWRDSGWVDVVVDDLLYVSIPKYDSLTAREKTLYHNSRERYNKSARKGSKSLFFAQSGTDNETWVPLIEKAYAKVHGSYASLDSGYTGEAVEDLTGGVSNVIHLNDILDPNRFWEEELMRVNIDRAFACSIYQITGADGGQPEINGLMTGHAYSIIKCAEHCGKKLIKIRNPWGEGEWTGRWGDGSKEWTSESIDRDTLAALDHKFGNDGEFLMLYEDFLSTWSTLQRTRLFDDTWRMSSLWLNVAAHPLPTAWTYGDVSFTFSLPKKTFCIIVLAQVDERFFKEISGSNHWSMDFVLYKKDSTEPIAESEHQQFWGRSVNTEIELDEGEYVVHVRLDRWPIRSKDHFNMNRLSWDQRKLSRIWAQEALGKSIAENFDSDCWRSLLSIPLDKYAGKDVTHVELEAHAAIQKKREEASALRAAAATTMITTTMATTTTAITTTTGLGLETVPPTPSSPGPIETHMASVAESLTISTVALTVESPLAISPVEANGSSTVAPASSGSTTDDDDDEKAETAPTSPIASSPKATNGMFGDPHEDKVTPSSPTPVPATRPASDVGGGDADDKKSVSSAGHGRPHSPLAPMSPIHMPSNPYYPTVFHHACEGCKTSPLTPPIYICMHPSCSGKQFCQHCFDTGLHPREHRVLRIEDPDDMNKLQKTSTPEDDAEVVLGLRVYTAKDAPATIQGQLRHGRVVQWSKE